MSLKLMRAKVCAGGSKTFYTGLKQRRKCRGETKLSKMSRKWAR